MKKKQAPKGKWRYGVVKRMYKTILPTTKGGVSRYQTTSYELVEVYDSGKSWTAEAISISADTERELMKTLIRVLGDVKGYDTIVEKKPIVYDMRKKK